VLERRHGTVHSGRVDGMECHPLYAGRYRAWSDRESKRDGSAIADPKHHLDPGEPGATELMKLSPKDGWVTAPEHTWVLAGGSTDPVLIYSLSGNDITFHERTTSKGI
jgi:hypothetical protein